MATHDLLHLRKFVVPEFIFGAAAIIQTVIAMAKHRNLQVMAEGVETWKQAQYLLGQNCFGMQRFYFGRPRSAENLAWFMKAR